MLLVCLSPCSLVPDWWTVSYIMRALCQSSHMKGIREWLVPPYRLSLCLVSFVFLAVFELLEQTGHVGAGEPLANLHPGVQPEGGGHHAPAPRQDAPAPETHRVSAAPTRPPTPWWPRRDGPAPPPAVANLVGAPGSLVGKGHPWKAASWPPHLFPFCPCRLVLYPSNFFTFQSDGFLISAMESPRCHEKLNLCLL